MPIATTKNETARQSEENISDQIFSDQDFGLIHDFVGLKPQTPLFELTQSTFDALPRLESDLLVNIANDPADALATTDLVPSGPNRSSVRPRINHSVHMAFESIVRGSFWIDWPDPPIILNVAMNQPKHEQRRSRKRRMRTRRRNRKIRSRRTMWSVEGEEVNEAQCVSSIATDVG